jgi:hypothetical protein
VYTKYHGAFARELLLKLFKEGGDASKSEYEDENSKNAAAEDTDVVEKIMIVLDEMIQKRHNMYTDEFVEAVQEAEAKTQVFCSSSVKSSIFGWDPAMFVTRSLLRLGFATSLVI